MSSLTFDRLGKAYGDSDRRQRRVPDDQGRRVRFVARPVRLRQDHDPAHGRGAGRARAVAES